MEKFNEFNEELKSLLEKYSATIEVELLGSDLHGVEARVNVSMATGKNYSNGFPLFEDFPIVDEYGNFIG